MNKLSILAALAFLLPVVAVAQQEPERKTDEENQLLPVATVTQPITIGAKAGLNYVNYFGDNAAFIYEGNNVMSPMLFFQSRTRLVAGITAAFPLSEYFTLQSELLYESLGGFASDSYEQYQYSLLMSVPYLTVPLLAKFTIPTGTIMTPCLYAGPALNFQIGSATVQTNSPSLEDRASYLESHLKTFVLGLAAGAGVDVAIGDGIASADLRYSLGLTSVASAYDNSSNIDLKNVSISLCLGYAFFF